MQNRIMVLGLCGFLACAGVGCVPEGTRQCADQSRKAIRTVADHPAFAPGGSAEDARAALDDAESCMNEVQQDIGYPKSPESYSPEAAARARNEAKKTRETRKKIGSGFLGLLENLPGPLGQAAAVVVGLGTSIFMWWKKSKAVTEGTKLLTSTVDGVEKLRENISDMIALAKAEGKTPEQIAAAVNKFVVDTMRSSAVAYGTYTKMNEIVNEFRGEIKK